MNYVNLSPEEIKDLGKNIHECRLAHGNTDIERKAVIRYLEAWRINILRKEEMSDYDRLVVIDLVGRIGYMTNYAVPK